MIITIVDIDHKQQRYETVGDWQWKDNNKENLLITISDMKDWRYNFLVAFHEQIEVMLCKKRNISQEDVDKFDIEYEKNRKDGDFSEPGDSPDAPYHKEHVIATKFERKMAGELGVCWEDYETAIYSL